MIELEQTINKKYFSLLLIMDFWDEVFDERLSGSDAESDNISVPNHDTSDSNHSEMDMDSYTGHNPFTSPLPFRSGLGQSEDDIYKKVKVVLDCMKREGLDLPIFLDAICWGNEKCIVDNQVRFARTMLLSSKEFPLLLHRWWRPPGARSESARKPLQDFAVKVVTSVVEEEMKKIKTCMSTPEDEFSQESLTSLDLEKLSGFLCSETGAPVLWSLLERAGWSQKQATKNTHKTPRNVSEVPVILHKRDAHG